MGKYGISYFHHVYVISIISMYYLSDLISIWIAWNGRGSPLEIDQQYCLLKKKKINSRVKIFFNWHWNGLDCFLQNFQGLISMKIKLAAFLDFCCFGFCNFQFNEVYNSILFSSPLVLLSNLDLRDFWFWGFIFLSPL